MMRWNEIMEGVGGWTPEAYANRKSPFGSRDVIEEPGFLYHGTAKVRLPAIRREGLMPATKARFARDPMIGEWSIGKVFFTTNADSAKFYATEASKTAPLLLRVPESAVADAAEDHKDNNAVYVEKAVPASVIEYWSGKAWKPVSQPLKESVDTLTALASAAKQIGVVLDVEMMEPDVIHLAFIQREHGRSGTGKIVMDKLCQYADQHGMEITLQALNNAPGLISYYQSMGFVPVEFSPEDFQTWFDNLASHYRYEDHEDDDGIQMTRSPK